MVSSNSLWRPRLFAATGTGFSADPHLNDGVHARWHVNHRLGLPYEKNGARNGVFDLALRIGGPTTIAQFDLIGAGSGTAFPIHDAGVFSQDAGLTGGSTWIRFWSKPDPILALFFMRLRGILDANPRFRWIWRETEQDFALRRYVADLVERLQPDLLPNTSLRAHTDACAVDIGFSGISAGAPSSNGQPYSWVEGLDRGGRIIDRDWVGLEPSGAPKTIARLRSAAFATVRWAQVPGQPPATRDQTRWVLSEDYCHASGWGFASEHWFNADPAHHTPSAAVTHFAPFRAPFFAPFGAPFDPVLVSDAIGNFLLSNGEIDALLSVADDVQAMAARSIAFAEAADAKAGKMRVSLLQSLIASGVDPVMARILGLYAFVDTSAQEPRGEDILIEAELPFFNPANLATLDQRLQGLFPEEGPDFFQNAALSLAGRRLAALIVSPDMSVKPPLPAPAGFATAIRSNALPAQGAADQTEILVRAEIEAPIDPIETAPELTPVAYCVERKISGGAYENVSEGAGDPDILDEIGLLPAVYFPGRDGDDWQKPLMVADDFTLASLATETVRYRMKAFDIFGRPSAAVEGSIETIEPPCTAPPPPLNPAARIAVESGRLMLEIDFALNGESPPLEAAWQRLEVTVHRLPASDPLNPDPSPPGEIAWAGKVPARRLAIDFLPGNVLHSGIAQSCVELEWAPDLTVTSAPADVCATLYPPPAPEMIATDPPSSSFAETGLRSYRLRVVIGATTGLAPAAYRWCARFATVGTCPVSGDPLDSQEVCAAADWLVHDAPPAVAAPITSVVPLTSFPDAHGDSWYDLDLSAYGLADGDLVNIYMARLHRLGDGAADLVSDGMLLNLVLFEEMARASRKPFELTTAPSLEFSASDPFHRIKVSGDLRQVYVLAIVGTNSYLLEQRWNDAGFTLFTTPERRPAPRLDFVRLSQSSDASGPMSILEFTADFAVAPDAAHPPKIQLFRRDLSSRESRLAYIGEATGASIAVEPGSDAAARYLFSVEDQKQTDWRSYEYKAQLIHYEPLVDGYLRGEEAATAFALATWDGTRSPIRDTDVISVAPATTQGLDVTFEFDCGELDFTLVRSLGGQVSSRFAGRLREGRAFGLDIGAHALAIVEREGRRRYRFTVQDENAVPAPPPDSADEPADGVYVLRVSYGQQATWTNRENVSS